jgi:sulfate transport system permease protein
MALETAAHTTKVRSVTTEHRWARWTLIGISLLFLTFILLLPMAAVFVEAFR